MKYQKSEKRMEAMHRRDKFYEWLDEHLDLIKKAPKGCSKMLQDKVKEDTGIDISINELQRWLFLYRRVNNLTIQRKCWVWVDNPDVQ